MIKLQMKGKSIKVGSIDGTFDTDDIEEVIDQMQKECEKINKMIFNSRTLWKVKGEKLVHSTMVSHLEFDIVRVANER
ncbi:hypothetical protein PANI_CDS0079 [Maribacter phage Panino]